MNEHPDTLPAARGLYDPRFEHDACGVSFVVDIKGRASHDIVTTGLGALCNLEHRGASGAEVNTGDGAGIVIQMPDRFLRSVLPFALPPVGAYAVGIAFLPGDGEERAKVCAEVEAIVCLQRWEWKIDHAMNYYWDHKDSVKHEADKCV